jgi:hypothetical protein
MSNSDEITIAPHAPEFGKLIGQCGPAQRGRAHYLYIGVGCVIMAVLSFIAPYTFLIPKPGDESAIQIASVVAGCFFACLAGVLVLLPMFEKPQVIFMYEKGIIERKGTSDRKIPLSSISAVKLFEWYEHRYAEQEYRVVVTIRQERELRFSSSLAGNSEIVIEHLTQNVANVDVVPFSA